MQTQISKEISRRARIEREKPKFYGRRFALLTVLPIEPKVGELGGLIWTCECACGKKKEIPQHYLVAKRRPQQSCGCLRAKGSTYAREKATKHGMAKTSEYRSWASMMTRCTNTKEPAYAKYGAVGRTVCDRWSGKNGFINFFSDMGLKPTATHTLERRDNARGYSHDNCYWATKRQQAQNTSKTVLITFNGETLCQQEWSRRTGIPQQAISRRLSCGWSITDTLTKPTDKRRGAKSGARVKAA